MATLRRFLRAGVKAEALTVKRVGRKTFYAAGPNFENMEEKDWPYNLACDGRLGVNDKRFCPRLGRVPIDVQRTLTEIMQSLGRPVRIEEIVAAWGRLREKRKAASLTGDMTAILLANQRRKARAEKRKRHHVD